MDIFNEPAANPYGNNTKRIHGTRAFLKAKEYANKYSCDLALPNDSGIGNILMTTRLVEAMAFDKGRRLKILTAPINPSVGVVSNEIPYPIWENNPFIDKIVNADEVEPGIMEDINWERDNFCHFGHAIENVCHIYGLIPRGVHPQIFLKSDEMKWAIDQLSDLKRPVVCLHPSGTSSVFENSPWFLENWIRLINQLNEKVSFFQVSKVDSDHKRLPVFNPQTTIREMMALIWASDCFVGFDSGPAHIATAFKRKSFVIWNVMRKNQIEEPMQTGFGPATMLRWSYPQNRNAMLLGEKDNDVLKLAAEFIEMQIASFNRKNIFP
jgi:hypothetical protein